MSGAPADRKQAERIEALLAFWFAGTRENPATIAGRMVSWFGADEARDREIRARFGDEVAQASDGRLDHWAAVPHGRLALIILLDQFRRNLYRGRSEAFACDAKALALTLDGLEQQTDAALAPVERLFFLMPLQHAESAGAQAISVREFARLCADTEPALRPAFQKALDYAREHCDVIARFGRFPHRNRALGRDSTPAELAWLEAGGETYGQ